MQIISTVAELRSALAPHRLAGRRIGFVPTMGFLHAGHVSLIEASVRACDVTVVSIFVNPTQFGPKEDLSKYPRDVARDEAACRNAGADIIFLPSVEEIYPPGFQTYVEPGSLAAPLCGAFRPGHFRGVATVVAKLFNMVQPHATYFGAKDFQQCAVVRQMIVDLNLPIEFHALQTVRESDGLAMSSRNAYLSVPDRARALSISQGLLAAQALHRQGERSSARLLDAARAHLDVDSLQYLELVDSVTLVAVGETLDGPAAMCIAAFIGPTRLIDNAMLQ
ncbi:pantoate--beta-alanine ligase [Methylovirgula sp. 4M-Z18]|uniref:pantoate--beta-alanine ligase n=1 Tax=Methylovirgula sp. 4M-Z18 TaxID=2293567 RepID=UPI000E2FA13B|nr:pantoate--beta-alanine ligase [Methylovirgula sp. 4M-Z18]RFB80874.1 pantoate--beta-alanine ligase [Methylovirgula sp. 4M-Z18]